MNRTNYTLLSIIAFSALYVVAGGVLANMALLASSVCILVIASIAFFVRDHFDRKLSE